MSFALLDQRDHCCGNPVVYINLPESLNGFVRVVMDDITFTNAIYCPHRVDKLCKGTECLSVDGSVVCKHNKHALEVLKHE